MAPHATIPLDLVDRVLETGQLGEETRAGLEAKRREFVESRRGTSQTRYTLVQTFLWGSPMTGDRCTTFAPSDELTEAETALVARVHGKLSSHLSDEDVAALKALEQRFEDAPHGQNGPSMFYDVSFPADGVVHRLCQVFFTYAPAVHPVTSPA